MTRQWTPLSRASSKLTKLEWRFLVGAPYLIMGSFLVPRILGWETRGHVAKIWFIVCFLLVVVYAIIGLLIVARRWTGPMTSELARRGKGRHEGRGEEDSDH